MTLQTHVCVIYFTKKWLPSNLFKQCFFHSVISLNRTVSETPTNLRFHLNLHVLEHPIPGRLTTALKVFQQGKVTPLQDSFQVVWPYKPSQTDKKQQLPLLKFFFCVVVLANTWILQQETDKRFEFWGLNTDNDQVIMCWLLAGIDWHKLLFFFLQSNKDEFGLPIFVCLLLDWVKYCVFDRTHWS